MAFLATLWAEMLLFRVPLILLYILAVPALTALLAAAEARR